jgi:acetolactate synthase-1/2/3 large subunit
MIGVHVAFQDSTPMILCVGLVGRGVRHREGFQEIDLAAMFGHTAKRVLIVDDPARIPELVSQAFHTAVNGRPGPVVIGLPEDVCATTAEVPDARPYGRASAAPAGSDMARLRHRLAAARRPLAIVGGGGWDEEAVADFTAFAEANRLPVAAAFRCQDLIDNRSPSYAGHCGLGTDPALAKAIAEADLVLAVGARLGEATTQGYDFFAIPTPRQDLIHVHPDPEELGRVYQGLILINAGMAEFAAAARALDPVDPAAWADWGDAAHAAYQATLIPDPSDARLDLGAALVAFRDWMDPSSLITTDAGNFAIWLNRFVPFTHYRSLVGPTCGAMGYAVPSAVAAKLIHPDRDVFAFVGDGGFLMTGQEFATAVQYGVAPIILVFNNNLYGTIRMHQERAHPGRPIATDLVNPDFAALARAFGGHGELVEETEAFIPALERARASGKPAIVEIRFDPDSITPRATLSGIRAAALAAGKR